MLHGGSVLEVFHTGKPGHPPPLPVTITVDAFCADNSHNEEVVKKVRQMKLGETLELPGLNRPCIEMLNAIQAWALYDASKTGGILGFISIGAGKTILALLMPLAVDNCKTAVILAKPDQRIHYRNHYLHLREHFHVPSLVFDRTAGSDAGSYIVRGGAPVAHLVPYSLLQQTKSSDLLDQINPDTVIADEVHCISAAPSPKRSGTTRTIRFLRFMANKQARFFCWSGSLINKSILDLTHLSAHALGMGSPYPILPENAAAFADVLDPLANPDKHSNIAKAIRHVFGESSSSPVGSLVGETKIRQGLRERAIRTPGVISTKASSATASSVIHKRDAPPLPPAVQAALRPVRDEWQRPDGEEFTEAAQKEECAREVGAGYYHRWIYPKGEPLELIEEWFRVRKLWNSELRERVRRGDVGLDSPTLLEHAAERAWREPKYDGTLPMWPSKHYKSWVAIRHLVQPESKAVWIDDFLARDAAAWAKEHRGIVWYHSRAFGAMVSKLADIPMHGGGPNAEVNIRAEKGDRSICASIAAHSESRDGLQLVFHKQLVAEVPSSSKGWDQLLGRLVRQQQAEDTVETWVYQHTPEFREALRKAVNYAEFNEEMSINRSLLLSSDFDFEV